MRALRKTIKLVIKTSLESHDETSEEWRNLKNLSLEFSNIEG